MCHPAPRRTLSFRNLLVAAFVLWGGGALPVAAQQLLVGFDNGPIIVDGGAGDTDGLVNGKIDFAGVYGSAGYFVQGRVQETPTWPVGASVAGQLSSPIYAITMTNFSAEAISTSTLGATLDVRFQSDAFAGSFAAGTAVDAFTAEVGNSASLAVLPSTDSLNFYLSAVGDNTSSIVLAPLTGGILPLGNPFHPGTGTTPYTVLGHGPTATPAFVNPWISALFQVTLGQLGDQFILPTSYEIGFSAVPEPSSWALLAIGFAGLSCIRRRRRG